ncbi:protein kinase domain-containing protein [Verticillium dahliae VdLs.17]|uniref:Protein kinase domain-containing protein n=1 Tax=Verticillium dahliae (strain VdLs.17 / ATCC MYA-4575 / FGSC 10137) TaxID=498257 RepID=G2XFZ7_VERDV|nr:protein kinase domain-containing protein [Verticillium dahliae VdLs.17]EGY18816.1 protein kinase domain-containing protein [Verticillium dahliae VdLs.17]
MTPAERRAVSVDRRAHTFIRAPSQPRAFPRASAPELPFEKVGESTLDRITSSFEQRPVTSLDQMVQSATAETFVRADHFPDNVSLSDTHSVTTSQYDVMIQEELERTWILNLSMHFRDKSKREKFFVTYRDKETSWRRVTISLDYRNAPENSLEMDLAHTKLQREKSAKIYEAIRESLQDIQFYETVTNLKLQTTDGRLHVHVMEDRNVCPLAPPFNEIINYPTVRQVQHLGCQRIRERDINFDSHMSGFVYKVSVGQEVLIKKEIPGPDTIDEFLYEINALNRLRYSRNVSSSALLGKGHLSTFCFVQGDFTLSNIVIDDEGDAKIIDINRRGCPVGWEPPEATPLIESGQRISMYIGVKSDLYQLGMVLWALATQEDEPETHGRPLILEHDVDVPHWYRELVGFCLSDDPRHRLQAASLLTLFPEPAVRHDTGNDLPSISVDDGYSMKEYFVADENGQSRVKTVAQPSDWSYVNRGQAAGYPQDPYYYTRGRSPPSPLPSHHGQFDAFYKGSQVSGWAGARNIAPSYSDVGADEMIRGRSITPRTSKDSLAGESHMESRGHATLGGVFETSEEPYSMAPASQGLRRDSTSLIPDVKDELDAAVTPTPNTPVKEDQKLLNDDTVPISTARMLQANDEDQLVEVSNPLEETAQGGICAATQKPTEINSEAEATTNSQQALKSEDSLSVVETSVTTVADTPGSGPQDTHRTPLKLPTQLEQPSKNPESSSAGTDKTQCHAMLEETGPGEAENDAQMKSHETPPLIDKTAPLPAEDALSTVRNVNNDESPPADDHGADGTEGALVPPSGSDGHAPLNTGSTTEQDIPVREAEGDDETAKATGLTVPGGENDDSNGGLPGRPEDGAAVGNQPKEVSTILEEGKFDQEDTRSVQAMPHPAEAVPSSKPEAKQTEDEEIIDEKRSGTNMPVAETISAITTEGPV